MGRFTIANCWFTRGFDFEDPRDPRDPTRQRMARMARQRFLGMDCTTQKAGFRGKNWMELPSNMRIQLEEMAI